MKFTGLLALAGAAAAWNNVTYTTKVVESVVTYCPYATVLTHGSSTYTVTAPTTLTITNCPCTITQPVSTSTYVACSTCSYNSTTPVKGPPPAATTSVYSTGGVKPSTTGPAPTIATAAANKVAAAGAGLAAVMGFAALL